VNIALNHGFDHRGIIIADPDGHPLNAKAALQIRRHGRPAKIAFLLIFARSDAKGNLAELLAPILTCCGSLSHCSPGNPDHHGSQLEKTPHCKFLMLR
jgi:hypothetical protein